MPPLKKCEVHSKTHCEIEKSLVEWPAGCHVDKALQRDTSEQLPVKGWCGAMGRLASALELLLKPTSTLARDGQTWVGTWRGEELFEFLHPASSACDMEPLSIISVWVVPVLFSTENKKDKAQGAGLSPKPHVPERWLHRRCKSVHRTRASK